MNYYLGNICRSSHGLLQGSVLELAWRDLKKTTKKIVKSMNANHKL
jgi:hypothetical protein